MTIIRSLLLATLLIFSLAAQAESKEGGPSPYAKLDTFTVNLAGMTQYLQVDISLKVADPKVGEAIKEWRPAIRHEVILLLTNQSGQELATLAGKKKVMTQIRTTINKILKLNEKSGVTDVLFESFVIQ